MRRLTLAAALAAALAPQASIAQEMDMEEMSQGLSMLELNVGRILEQHNVDVDPMSLSLNQIATIISQANSEDDSDGGLTPSRLEAILK